jgi:hypothetical protein
MFEYQIEMAGVRVKNSKIIPRELTEEEKAEQEAKNSKKKPDAPKKGQKEEEPSPEELQRKASEELEKAESKKQLEIEWNALTDDEKFYKEREDIFKEPSIKF